ncbi:MAG: anaerobic ribonucleoside-triphosphate reductase activating protein [Methanosarcinaceae archaeon]|nr:anaerobic ribonucleoside-triphosphate reductase activating protein [Methanosarcinaceae archaeon]
MKKKFEGVKGHMKVNYGGTVPISTVDWPGKAAVTIFFRGCPLRCPYCHNHSYLEEPNLVDLAFVKKEIEKSRPFVSSVVFSGGEPLMQAVIVPLAVFAKEQGFFVGIHTNGCYPERVGELLEKKLVDKFFVDLKAPLEDPDFYGKVAGYGKYKGVQKSPEKIVAAVSETIAKVDSSASGLELRTTLIKDFIGREADISRIVAWISKNVQKKDLNYVLQQGQPENGLQESLRERAFLEREEMLRLGALAKNYLENVRIRTKEAGEEKV